MPEKIDEWDISLPGSPAASPDLRAALEKAQPTLPPAESFSSVFIAAEQSPAAIALATLAGSIIYLNRRGRQLFGIDPAANVTGSSIAEIVREQQHVATLEAVARDGVEREMLLTIGKMTQEPKHIICRARRVDGVGDIASWLALSAIEVRETANAGVVGISDSGHYRSVLKLAGVGNWDMKVDDDNDWLKNPVTWDSGMYALVNVRPENVTASSESFMEFVVPEDRQSIVAGVQSHLQHGTPFEVVFRIKPRGGLPRMLLSRGMVTGDRARGEARRFLGITQDITSLLGARPQLLEMEAVLNAVAENIEGPVYSLDRKFHYTYFNQFFRRAIQQLYGVDTQLGERVYHAVKPGPRRTEVLNHIRRAFEGQRIVEVAPIAWKDSIVEHFELTYAPIVDGPLTSGVVVVGVRVNRS